MKPLAALGAGFLLIYGAAGAAERCPDQVRVSLPNFEIAPYVLGADKVANPPGLLVEWTRNALQLSGCKPRIVIKRRPPNRQLAELEMGLLDVLPGFSFNDDPDDQLVFPIKDGGADAERSLIPDTASLYVRAAERSVEWDGKTLRSANPRVGSSTGGVSSAQRTARQFGWQIEVAPTPHADLRKLIAGRIDVILEPDVVMRPYLSGPEGRAVRKLSPPARITYRFAPVSKRFQAAYPEFTKRFWSEMCRQARGPHACK